MKIGILNKSEIEFINTSLLNNQGINSDEFKTFSRRHPRGIGCLVLQSKNTNITFIYNVLIG
jgi:hypothetical protein